MAHDPTLLAPALLVAALLTACSSSTSTAAPPADDPLPPLVDPHRIDELAAPLVPSVSAPVATVDLVNAYLDPVSGELLGNPAGTATVTFDLVQAPTTTLALALEHSLDAGATWLPSTVLEDLSAVTAPIGLGVHVPTEVTITWDLATDLWPGTFAAGGEALGTPAIDLRLVIVGGAAGPATPEPVEVDLLGFPFPALEQLATPRSRHAGLLDAGDQLLVVGGLGPGATSLGSSELGERVGHLVDFFAEDPTALAVPRSDLAQVQLPDGRTLLVGGRDAGGPRPEVDAHDPTTGLITPLAPLHRARAGAAACLLPNGLPVVLAGDAEGDSYELLDLTTGQWVLGSLGQAYEDPLAVLLSDGRVLLTGAEPGTDTPRSELLDLSDDLILASSPAPVPGTVRRGGTATVLTSGDVLFLGGRLATGQAASPTAELLDATTGAWTALPTDDPDIPGYQFEARWGHRAQRTGSGRVFVSGGRTATTGGVLERTDYFLPDEGRFEPACQLPEPVAHHRVDRLAGGYLVVSGGEGPTGAPTAGTASLVPPDGQDSLPTASIQDLTYQPPLGQVVVDYTLADAESHPTRVRLEWTTRPQEPNSWRAMTLKYLIPGFPLGDGYHELETSPEGTAHNFAWNVIVDDIFAMGSPQTVHVRVTPIGAEKGQTVEFSKLLP